MTLKINAFIPCSNEHYAIKDFKKLETPQKSLIIILTAVSALFSLGLFSTFLFRKLVHHFTKLDPRNNQAVQKVDLEAQKQLQPQKLVETREEDHLPQKVKVNEDQDLQQPIQEIPLSIPVAPINKQDIPLPPLPPVAPIKQIQKELIRSVIQADKEQNPVKQNPVNEVKKIENSQPVYVNSIEIKIPHPDDIPQDFMNELIKITNRYSNIGIFLLHQAGTRLDHINLPNVFNSFKSKHKNLLFIALKNNTVDYSDREYEKEMKNFFQINSDADIKLITGTIYVKMDINTNKFVRNVVDENALLNKIEDQLKVMA